MCGPPDDPCDDGIARTQEQGMADALQNDRASIYDQSTAAVINLDKRGNLQFAGTRRSNLPVYDVSETLASTVGTAAHCPDLSGETKLPFEPNDTVGVGFWVVIL